MKFRTLTFWFQVLEAHPSIMRRMAEIHIVVEYVHFFKKIRNKRVFFTMLNGLWLLYWCLFAYVSASDSPGCQSNGWKCKRVCVLCTAFMCSWWSYVYWYFFLVITRSVFYDFVCFLVDFLFHLKSFLSPMSWQFEVYKLEYMWLSFDNSKLNVMSLKSENFFQKAQRLTDHV